MFNTWWTQRDSPFNSPLDATEKTWIHTSCCGGRWCGRWESSGKLPLRTQHNEIPWAPIIGMPHRLVHAYFDINTDILWNAATKEIPTLLPGLLILMDLE